VLDLSDFLFFLNHKQKKMRATNIHYHIALNHTAVAIIAKLKSDGDAVDGDETACEEMRMYSGIEKTDYVPHCFSEVAQVTVVLPLWFLVSKEIGLRANEMNIPVVSSDGDERATQTDGDHQENHSRDVAMTCYDVYAAVCSTIQGCIAFP
jgi:hypothetical protein